MSNLGIVDLAQNGAGNEVEANAAHDLLEGHRLILDRDLTAPPGSPSDGDAYIIAASATGDWVGQDGKGTVYSNGWRFFTAYDGWNFFLADENLWMYYDGTNYYALKGIFALPGATPFTPDLGLGATFTVTLVANSTISNPSTNLLPGQRYVFEVTQDGTGGWTLAWGTEYEFAGGTAPTPSAGAGDVDVFVFEAISTTRMVLVASALNVS